MNKIRTQIVIAIAGLGLIGFLLYTQSLGLLVSVSPAPGGTYVEGVIGEPRELNPLLFSHHGPDRDIAKLVYAGMLKFDGSGQPIPDLAESWAVTADGLSYTFVIRSGLRWHDGVPLSLDDVIFTIGLMQSLDYPGPADTGELWRQIAVAKLNNSTLKLTLPEPYAPFLDHVTFPVLPAHMFSGVRSADLKLHPANMNPVGSGPFKVENLNLGDGHSISEIVLTTNPFYHGDTPMLTAIKLKYYLDESSSIEALRQNEIMGVGGLSQKGIDSMLNNVNFDIHSSLLPETKMILLNQQNESLKFFREKKVRLALLLGLNRKFFVNEFLSGQAVLASSPIPPGNWAYNDSLKNTEYNPDSAADLLSESGWAFPETDVGSVTDNLILQKDGEELEFELLVPNDDLSVVLGQIAVDDWGKLGVNALLQIVEPDILEEEYLDTREFQAIMIDVSLQRTPDPDPYPFWHQTEIESGQNYSGYDNRRISEYIEQARTTPSISTRSSLYHMFQKRFVDDTPALLVYHPVYSYVTNKVVHGVQMGPIVEPSDRFNGISNWYIVIRRVVGRLTN
ncbi:MAG TPA: hypothetical protein DGN60_03050 [Chloroflexi bacterium]|nr:hypothetical protein [Chloroflexota bacterium]